MDREKICDYLSINLKLCNSPVYTSDIQLNMKLEEIKLVSRPLSKTKAQYEHLILEKTLQIYLLLKRKVEGRLTILRNTFSQIVLNLTYDLIIIHFYFNIFGDRKIIFYIFLHNLLQNRKLLLKKEYKLIQFQLFPIDEEQKEVHIPLLLL